MLKRIRSYQCRITLVAPFWPQRSWFSLLLELLVAPPVILHCTQIFCPNTGEVAACQYPKSKPIRLEIVRNSIRGDKFSGRAAECISGARRKSTSACYDAKWAIFTNWCSSRQVNSRNPALGEIADFFIYLFEQKKCAPSTIKGYRSALASAFKFGKGGVKSNSTDIRLSELVRYFEKERPLSKSLAPKWNLTSCAAFPFRETLRTNGTSV